MVEEKDVLSKMFVGGLSWDTTKEGLQSYFCRFGEIIDCVVMQTENGRSRGFGFVTFKDAQTVKVVCEGGPHRIDNRVVDPKPCNPRGGPGKGGGKRGRGCPKIFVGGLPSTLNEIELKDFFQENYGDVFEVVIMYDQERRKSRGFGFVSFENEESVENACRDHYISINGKKVECKRAQPRDMLEMKMGGPQGGMRNDYFGYGNPGPRGPPQGGPQGDFRNGSFGASWGGPGPQDGPPSYSAAYGSPQAGPNGWGGGHPGAAAPHSGWSSSQPPASYGQGAYGGPGHAAPAGTAGYGGYGAPTGGYGPPGGPGGQPGQAPPGAGYGGYGAPSGAAQAPPNGYNSMGGSYGQDASSYGPARGGYETYGSAYSTATAPGTERANGAPMAPPAAGSYHPYRR